MRTSVASRSWVMRLSEPHRTPALRIGMRDDALMTTPDAAPEPSEMDRALLRAVSDEVAELPDGVAPLTHAWSDGGGMWFVEVQPREPRAAFLSVAFDGEDLLNFTVGNIWFEVFPIDTAEELTDCARKVARAVVQGHLEESGFTGDAYGRIFVEDGPAMSVGRVHLPWPWRLRPFRRRYRPYAPQLS